MMRFILFLLNILISINVLSNTPYQLTNVGVTNNIGVQINDDIVLLDEFNKEINLKELVESKPSIINFVYLNCPLLCHLHLDGILDVVKKSDYKVFDNYQIITISIDPKESSSNLSKYKEKYTKELGITNGWYFLKGTKNNIKSITNQLGYGYKYIKRTNDYSHPAVVFFYNKKLTNYMEGVLLDKKSFDLNIMNLKEKKSVKERIITYCYYFDPDNQTYSMLIFKILRILCLITVLIISILIFYSLYRERTMKKI